MQFQVPQFIEVEDKIFGPLTLKQFIYILGGAASAFILWTFLPAWLAILLIIPIGSFFLALAFLKVNGQPFIKVLGDAVGYSAGARLYTWKKPEAETVKKMKAEPGKTAPAFQPPKLTESKLKELSWSLDIHQKLRR